MIPFTPRRVDDTTLFFFHKRYSDDLRAVLDENMVTGWGLYDLYQALPHLPENYAVPNVYAYEDDRKAKPESIAVFVSHYDTNDMAEFLKTVIEHPDTLKRRKEKSMRLSHLHTWEQKMEQDPDPWDFRTAAAK